MSTSSAVSTQQSHRLGLADPATYRRTLHLLLDLPVGIAAFSIMLALLSTSVALAITVVGLPVLAASLLLARWIGRVERARAQALLGVTVAEPAPSPRRWRRLTDPVGWRAAAYSIVMLPVGVATSVIATTGWVTGVAALTLPAWTPFTDQSSVTLGQETVGGPGWQIATSLAGALLLLVMPAVVRGLSRIDAAVVRRLL